MLKKIVSQYYKDKFAKKKFIAGKTFIPSSGKVFDKQELLLACQAVLDGWWTEGRFANAFEKKLAKILKVKYCLSCNSGSSANLISISALTSKKLGKKSLKPGDEVITTAACFPTTVNPLITNNLVPVFVDINLGNYNVNVKQLNKALSKKTKAVILTHTLGNPFNLDFVVDFCQKNRLWLIEDNCDSLGAKYKNKLTGSFGHLSTLSFYPAHHITTGEGGAVFTSEAMLARIVRSIRDWGRDCWCKTGENNACKKRFSWKLGNLPKGYDHKYIYSETGYNLKITDMQAAIGLAQLEKLNKFIAKRRENFNYFYKLLENLQDYFILPQVEKNSQPSWFGFPLTIRANSKFKRKDLLVYLNKYKIDSRLLFAGNIVKQPYFKNYKIKHRVIGNLKNSNHILKNSFWLGLYPGLNKEKLKFVADKIKDFAKNN